MSEFQTSLTFAHEVSHNLNATHDVDKYGVAVSGTLMGATLGNHIRLSNLTINPKTKTAIRNFLTEVGKGLRYDLFKTLDNLTPGTPIYSTKDWTQDDQNRFMQGYHRINCFKTKLDYSNDKKHFLKLKQDLENQINPKIPTPESTMNSGSINFNITYSKYVSLFSQLLLLFSCTYMSHF